MHKKNYDLTYQILLFTSNSFKKEAHGIHFIRSVCQCIFL